MTGTATTQPAATIKRGTLAIYWGSRSDYHGILFEVVGAYNAGCDLAYEGEPHEIVLGLVRPSSLQVVDRADILTVTCPGCQTEYWYLRGTERPACNLTLCSADPDSAQAADDERDDDGEFCWICGEEGHLPSPGCAKRAGME